jgi:Papain-like cysteine protease AvrRpt2
LINVPYVSQEREHYSGAACASMLGLFYQRNLPSQDVIMDILGARDYRNLKHETFEVLLSDFFAQHAQLLPAHYSPAIHIAPRMKDGIASTDFIRGIPQVRYISRHDFYVFKRLLLARRAPLIVRIHFTTELYPMLDEIAQFLDVTGHCLLIVGYNSEGFIVHDPWDQNRFGGNRGGSSQVMAFDELSFVTVMVNCSYEDGHTEDTLGLYSEHLTKAVYPERDIGGRLVLFWPGIDGVMADRWLIEEVTAKFSTNSRITFRNQEVTVNIGLGPGQVGYIPYKINTGDQLGSFQVRAEIEARLTCPTFPWVDGRQPVNTIITGSASYRISVQATDWFRRYAMP